MSKNGLLHLSAYVIGVLLCVGWFVGLLALPEPYDLIVGLSPFALFLLAALVAGGWAAYESGKKYDL